MSSVDCAQAIRDDGVIAIVRLDEYTHAVDIVRALADGGVRVVEFTYTNPKAGEAIAACRDNVGESVYVGAGTVLDPATARVAILAGAQFLVTPTLVPDVVTMARRYDVPTVIGAFTPTEIQTAWEAGATFVKLFPARAVGPSYITDVHGPLPHIPIIPTGGVGAGNAAEYIAAGAAAVALGTHLVDAETVRREDWATLTDRAREIRGVVDGAR